MNTLFYKPENAWAGDVIPYYENGVYYAFYLHDPRRKKDKYAEDTTWHLVTTKDFVNLTDCGEAIARGGDDAPNKNLYTGSVIKDAEGTYHAFYTAFNADARIDGRSVQSVMQATGPDLYHLKTVESFCFRADNVQYEPFDWRDPFVFWSEEEHCYKMLLAARNKGAGGRRGGCIALCQSKDLMNWTYEKPFYEPNAYITMECPEVFQMGGWYYLVFSTFSDRFVTHYRKSRTPRGPWLIPEDDVFDNRANYAIKTAGHGLERYAFGWIPSRKGNTDFGDWEWGGTMDFLKLAQDNETGDLYALPTDGCLNYFKEPAENKNLSLYHAALRKEESGMILETEGELGAMLYDIPADDFSLEISFTCESRHEFGVALHMDEGLEEGYFLKISPRMNTIAWDLWPRAEWGREQWQIAGDVPYKVETARTFENTGEYKLFIVREGDICVVYLNDKIALSNRLYGYKGKKAGLFLSQGNMVIKNFSFKVKL